jgi:hypothetical protein
MKKKEEKKLLELTSKEVLAVAGGARDNEANAGVKG